MIVAIQQKVIMILARASANALNMYGDDLEPNGKRVSTKY